MKILSRSPFINFRRNMMSIIPNSQSKLDNSFFMFDITQDEIVQVVKSLKTNTSWGHDEIPMKVIKASIDFIIEPLTFIINRSFTEGIFPDNLKITIVKPLHKKGSKDDLNNYRPISILSSFSKVFEKILSNRMSNFFRKFNVISGCQHGFVKNKNIETAIFELINDIVLALEQGQIPMALFLDLSKAFCVDHRKLLEVLDNCDIRDSQLKLIESYLKSRKQRVVLEADGETFVSDEIETILGLPQGSIVGPLLFIIYVNSLPKAIKSECEPLIERMMKSIPSSRTEVKSPAVLTKSIETNHALSVKSTMPSQDTTSMRLFADDTNILTRSSCIPYAVDVCNIVVNSVKTWLCNYNLVLNIEKTKCMIFHSDNSKLDFPETVDILDSSVVVEDNVKFLGIVLDSQLKWGPHTEQLKTRLSSACYTLFMLIGQVNFDVLKLVYFANFHSILSYGIIFGGSSSNVENIFVVQKRALRTMLRLSYRESCIGNFEKNNILTVYGLYVYRLLLFFRKRIHYFEDYKNVNNTRRMFPYNVPIHRTILRERTVECMAISMYNALPKTIRMITCDEDFKKSLYCFILKSEPYSLSEFISYCRR